MTYTLRRVEAHYESREVPFGKIYKWHPAYVAVECGCGEKLVIAGNDTATTCRCGAEFGALAHEIKEREGRLPDKAAHPWDYDAQERAEQHLRDEASYPGDSSWRYNDITSGSTDEK